MLRIIKDVFTYFIVDAQIRDGILFTLFLLWRGVVLLFL